MCFWMRIGLNFKSIKKYDDGMDTYIHPTLNVMEEELKIKLEKMSLHQPPYMLRSMTENSRQSTNELVDNDEEETDSDEDFEPMQYMYDTMDTEEEDEHTDLTSFQKKTLELEIRNLKEDEDRYQRFVMICQSN
jgi:protein tyrosine/serine phosphatase